MFPEGRELTGCGVHCRQGFPIEALAPALAPPPRLGLQESSLTMPLVYVAAGPHEIGLWDVEQGKCHQVPAPLTQVLMAVPL